MKKTLIALAVLGAAAGVAHAQTNVTIYGQLQPSYDYLTAKDVNGAKTKTTAMNNNSSRIGFMGSEDLGGGLKAIFKLENQFDMVNGVGTGSAARDTYIGLAGKFGTVMVGNIDSTYKAISSSYDPFVDTIGDYNSIMGKTTSAVTADSRWKQSLNYVSPSFSGFQLLGNYSLSSNWVDAPASNLDARTWGLGAVYNNGPLNILAAYENQNQGNSVSEDAKFWKIGAAYSFGQGTSLRGMYEKVKQSGSLDSKHWLIGAEHKMGAFTVMANYINAGDNNGVDNTGAKAYNLGLNYALSKRTSVMGVYSYLKNDAAGVYDVVGYTSASDNTAVKTSGLSVRLQHKF